MLNTQQPVPVMRSVGLWSLLWGVSAFAVATSAFGQTSYGGLIQSRYPLLSSYPPLSTGMSYDVLLAYIVGDSLCRSTTLSGLNGLVSSLDGNDSLRQIARFLYEATDYDPVLFFQWQTTDPTHRYLMLSPGTPVMKLRNLIQHSIPDSGRTGFLCDADMIADVRVNYTVEGIDSGASRARHHVKVDCSVIDTIKGKHFPECIPDFVATPGHTKHGGANVQTYSGGCLQFEYALEWDRASSSSDYEDTPLGDTITGARWVQPDSEYIVFLQLGYLRSLSDTSHTYSDCLPLRWFGTSCGVYPVMGGIVRDPFNDFGFGAGLTVAQFKSRLRAKIYSVIHP